MRAKGDWAVESLMDSVCASTTKAVNLRVEWRNEDIEAADDKFGPKMGNQPGCFDGARRRSGNGAGADRNAIALALADGVANADAVRSGDGRDLRPPVHRRQCEWDFRRA